MNPIAIAMGLAQFAPQIIKWVTGSDKAEQAAEQVINIAQSITGKIQPDEVLEVIKTDPALALQFRKAIIENEADLDKAFMADVADARKRDSIFVQLGKRNYRADIMFLLAIAVITWLVWIVWKEPAINEYVKGIFTLVLGRFLGYLDNIYNFEFGSTRSSKTKDTTIERLSSR